MLSGSMDRPERDLQWPDPILKHKWETFVIIKDLHTDTSLLFGTLGSAIRLWTPKERGLTLV